MPAFGIVKVGKAKLFSVEETWLDESIRKLGWKVDIRSNAKS